MTDNMILRGLPGLYDKQLNDVLYLHVSGWLPYNYI
ncbi:unnamed protein product (macronuclear) [Paramecium tetraurelia]|uniref:Uncharacterized protein n=1 Tax=Paramecium tetraurelia TaxID=5888 RepID=A0DSM2_PARTE|nr:uncharacterized protein GSPATT00039745001 [Paramecium tetraurelia]CAK86039.1 unnamed protein product [Paramecium tetraurelia]